MFVCSLAHKDRKYLSGSTLRAMVELARVPQDLANEFKVPTYS